jgi:hypothetical protein
VYHPAVAGADVRFRLDAVRDAVLAEVPAGGEVQILPAIAGG